MLLSNRAYLIEINGTPRKINIDDVEVYPEGAGAVVKTGFEGVIIDIGGRTTDACMITNEGEKKKIGNPYSIPRGTLNLYSDFIKVINSRHGLDLMPENADRIIRNGLKIEGEAVDFTIAMDVFRQFVESLVGDLQVEYSLKTNEVLLIGGGCNLLSKALSNRIPTARLINNPVFANANGFREVGEQLWR
jgi:plasmid segregation protein ParM